MYGLTVITPPATAPITAADLRTRLRLYDSSEDSLLDELLAAAVDLFEHDTGCPVLATVYRQDFARWPLGNPIGYPWNGPPFPVPQGYLLGGWPAAAIVLGRGLVTAVASVQQYNADGSLSNLTASTWRADLLTPPARIVLNTVPGQVLTAGGVPVTPVGCVTFTAGWADAASVPKSARAAIMLLAAHWYENREAYAEKALAELPLGWRRITARFKTGIEGDWGQ